MYAIKSVKLHSQTFGVWSLGLELTVTKLQTHNPKPQNQMETEILSAKGRLGVLTVGMGAVSTTFIAGVIAVCKGMEKPIGSYTQLGTIRLGKRTENRNPLIKDFVELANLDELVFG